MSKKNKKLTAPVFFPKDQTFAEAFPDIADIRIEVNEIGIGVTKSTTVALSNMRNRVACSNRQCEKGGLDINMLVNLMYGTRQSNKTDKESCHGIETKNFDRHCMHHFDYNVSITYKPEPGKGDKAQ